MRSCVIGQIRKPFFVDLRQNFAWTRKTSLNGSEKINRKFHCCGILTSTRLLSSGRGSLQVVQNVQSPGSSPGVRSKRPRSKREQGETSMFREFSKRRLLIFLAEAKK